MPLIAHISDLHFGYTTQPLEHALHRALHQAKPTLMVISGDLTQRARESQFAAAQRFVETLPHPLLVVPGNHDVPLYDIFRRFFRKSERFRRYISDDLTPVYQDESMCVVGVDSTRAFTLDPYGFWKNGSLSDAQLEMIHGKFLAAPEGLLKVLVMHHPLVNPWNEGSRDTVRGRERIIRVLEQVGVEVVLSGHLHIGYGGNAPVFTPDLKRKILCIQAGTAISTRLRNESNAFNLLDWDGAKLSVTIMRYNGADFVRENTNEHALR